ncbi:MEDS domain-containing protein [Fuchsiella alkaliacetigena]|uniref:MEDS domain-containing protein n=1 Tax=Fuchsiella alkaliacetigena TaxID=957042 RepID=UPI00200B1E20|nr:MEDS domain-containing protein [Fuchsiella alkaliacetigena]MCK8825137.1 MEDS domain-containing protein [Fuchsiella alkaliacetigena]
MKFNDFKDFEDVFGLHPVFYYYGFEHLLVNMIPYIKQGLENDELIYFSCADDLYQRLVIENLDFRESIELKSIIELLASHKFGEKKGLAEKIENLVAAAQARGYSGIRWVCQPGYVMQTNSKEDFLKLEENLSSALKDTKLSLLCIYEFEDYLEEKEYIDQKVINKSLATHEYLLNQFSLKKNDLYSECQQEI